MEELLDHIPTLYKRRPLRYDLPDPHLPPRQRMRALIKLLEAERERETHFHTHEEKRRQRFMPNPGMATSPI